MQKNNQTTQAELEQQEEEEKQGEEAQELLVQMMRLMGLNLEIHNKKDADKKDKLNDENYEDDDLPPK